jgi:molecular chaperone HscB
MIDFTSNYFDLFGLPSRFRFDAAALDAAYRTLQSRVHPDRHASGSDADRRLALQSSARVNEAYRALRDPVQRAWYILRLNGVDAGGETDTQMSFEFLEQQLERREAAAEALAEGDASRLAELLESVRADARAIEDRLAVRLDSEHAFGDASPQVREFAFLAKLADDLNAMLATLDE